MYVFPDRGRRIAHIILDSVVGGRIPAEDEATGGAAAFALASINQVEGAVPVELNPPGAEVDVAVDLSNVLLASLVLVDRLAEELAVAKDVSVEQIVGDLREYLDQ
jgi:hypothetical protein